MIGFSIYSRTSSGQTVELHSAHQLISSTHHPTKKLYNVCKGRCVHAIIVLCLHFSSYTQFSCVMRPPGIILHKIRNNGKILCTFNHFFHLKCSEQNDVIKMKCVLICIKIQTNTNGNLVRKAIKIIHYVYRLMVALKHLEIC